MSVDKINKIKKQLDDELAKEVPDKKIVKKLENQIMYFGLGLNPSSFTQKPFTKV